MFYHPPALKKHLTPPSHSTWYVRLDGIYVKCVCNFKLHLRPGRFWSHSVIVPSVVHSFQNWSENSPGHTYLTVSLVQSTPITLSSPFLPSLSNSFFRSLLIFYLHLTYIYVSCYHCTFLFPFIRFLSLFFLFEWISLSCCLWKVWFFNEWNAIPSRCHRSSNTK